MTRRAHLETELDIDDMDKPKQNLNWEGVLHDDSQQKQAKQAVYTR